MKRAPLTYHLLLALIGGYAILAFARINKHSFYHHYYRVIEEVQTRNSQEWDAAGHVAVFADLVSQSPEFDTFLPYLAGLKLGTHVLHLPARQYSVYSFLGTNIWYLLAHPAQAP